MPKKRLPDPLESGNIPGQNPATPERMPGHTRYYDTPSDQKEGKAPKAKQEPGEEDELDEALKRTFPASDPISSQSPLISRPPKSR